MALRNTSIGTKLFWLQVCFGKGVREFLSAYLLLKVYEYSTYFYMSTYISTYLWTWMTLFSHVLCLTAAVSLPKCVYMVPCWVEVYVRKSTLKLLMHYTTDFRNSVLRETWDLHVIQDFELPTSLLTLNKKGTERIPVGKTLFQEYFRKLLL